MLRPTTATANLPLLTVLDDDSVWASGDQNKRQVYDLSFQADMQGVTALRNSRCLPDDRSAPVPRAGASVLRGAVWRFLLERDFRNRCRPRPCSQVRLGRANRIAGGVSAPRQRPSTAIRSRAGRSMVGQAKPASRPIFQFRRAAARFVRFDDSTVVRLAYYCGRPGTVSHCSVTRDARPGWRPRSGPARSTNAALLKPEESYSTADRQQLMAYYLVDRARSWLPRRSARDRKSCVTARCRPNRRRWLSASGRQIIRGQPSSISAASSCSRPIGSSPTCCRCLPPLPAEVTHNRLAFARWLVDGRNPLTGRVTVNRMWQALFGRGLVRTTEDFGYQGELPTHPELLDWLAVQIVNEHWSLKQMLQLIVTSATYQQSSRAERRTWSTSAIRRTSCWRARPRASGCEAELVRDVMLRSSGLLSAKIGGPSVFPPQPPGVTSEGTYGPLTWNTSTGEDRYRRGLYTFAKRTAPYAMTAAFDGPSGEACTARRETSNTPLQALTLLNDAVAVEAAQALGRAIADGPGTDRERAALLFRRVIARPPSDRESDLMLAFLDQQRTRLASGELKGAEIAGAAEGDVAARAAWTLVARAVLNLDEAVTKE